MATKKKADSESGKQSDVEDSSDFDEQLEQLSQNIQATRKLLTISKRNHTRYVNKLQVLLRGGTISENKMNFARTERDKMVQAWKEMQLHYTRLVLLQDKDDDELKTDLDNHEDVLELFYDKISDLPPTVVTKPESSESKSDSEKSQEAKPATPRMRIPEMKPFENTVRKYPNFKATFRKYYEKHYGEHAPVVLKNNYLKGFAQELCESCETVDDIFHTLELEYGDQGQIIEAVMEDISGLPVCQEDGDILSDLTTIRKMLKSAQTDLECVKLGKHLEHFQTVMTITSKFPSSVSRRWAELVARDRIPVEKRFGKLVEFLALEIRTLELLKKPNSNNEDKDKKGKGFGAQGYRDDSFGQNQGGKPPKCLLHPHMSNHFLSKCRKLKTISVNDQVKFLQGIGKELCRSCLRKHEGSCAIEIICAKENCSKKHFSFLHSACDQIRPRVNVSGISYLSQIRMEPQNSSEGQCMSTTGQGQIQKGQGQTQQGEGQIQQCQGQIQRHGHVSQKTTNGSSSQSRCPEYSQIPHSNAISPAQYVDVSQSSSQSIVMFWDQGSNLTLITKKASETQDFEFVEEEPTNLIIETVGSGELKQSAPRCKVPLYDSQGKHVDTVLAYVVDCIGTLPKITLEKAKTLFGIKKEMLYPSGDIDLLLGADNGQIVLHPVTEINGLRLDESDLGRIIWGRHSSFTVNPHTRVARARHEPLPMKTTGRAAELLMDQEVKSLFSTETLGISCTPRCGRCSCGKCSIDGTGWSLQEKHEYQQIRDSISVENNVITASYPYQRNPAELPNNRNYAMKRLLSLERDLSKDAQLATSFIEQFDDMISRQKMRLAEPQELKVWKGAVNYLPMNYVLKGTSTTTPLRIVFDSSAKVKGICVNDIWGRGPNLIRDALGILVRFCEYQVAIFADVKKMYQTIMTKPKEWHLHRILWRNLETTKDPDTYLIVCNSFGDGPAGTVAIAAIHFLAEKFADKFPDASKTLLENVYVDDILESCVDIESAKQLAENIDETLKEGSFSVKKWNFVDSGALDSVNSSSSTLQIGGETESVLGISYNMATDKFYFQIHLNFGKKKRGAKVLPDLEKDQIFDRTVVPKLSKRNILSQVHTIYDPLGKIQPFLTELKFLLGKLYRYKNQDDENLSWDEPAPPEYDELWRKTLNLFFDIKDLRFPRCLSPCQMNVSDKPILVAMADSSMIAFGACLYLWWQIDDGFFSRLVCAKSKMWPIDPQDYLSVCRGELQAALIAKKLVESFLKWSRFELQEIVFVIDSEIVHAQISMDSHNFSIFVGHRVAEIRSQFPPELWWLVKSDDNPSADLLSRGTRNLSELNELSVWQNGPKWLQSERKSWPLSQNRKHDLAIPELRANPDDVSRRVMMVTSSIPAPVVPTNETSFITLMIQNLGENQSDVSTLLEDIPRNFMFSSEQFDVIEKLFDLSRHDDLHKWLGITYRVLVALSWRKGDGCFFQHTVVQTVISTQQRQVALKFWLKQAQKDLIPRMRAGQYKTLTPFLDEDGIYRCNRRAKETGDPYCPILLPATHPFSRLIVTHFHRRGHLGAVATAAKVRTVYHILKLRNIAISVRNSCHTCRKVEKRLMKAPMGSIPPTRLKPGLPFEHCSCDLFGPFLVQLHVKETRNRRKDPAYTKAVGLLITCLATRAVHIEAMHGQSTEAFLHAFRRFSCIRGQPRSMFSDCGGQLVSADENLKSLVEDFDMTKIKDYGATRGMIWTFASPGSSWQNGVTEALVSSVKKTLKLVIDPKKTKLPILELQTVFYEVAQILNERPINLGSQGASGNDFDSSKQTYICPNELLLGRSTTTIHQGPFSNVNVPNEKRLSENQNLITEWWTKWTELYLPTLINQSKWYKLSRKAKIGDIVYVKDLNPVRGQWGIGEIVQIHENYDNVPRNVLVRFSNPGGSHRKTEKTLWRDVKNLSVIVKAEERPELNPNH